MADHILEMAGNGLFCDYSFVKKLKPNYTNIVPQKPL